MSSYLIVCGLFKKDGKCYHCLPGTMSSSRISSQDMSEIITHNCLIAKRRILINVIFTVRAEAMREVSTVPMGPVCSLSVMQLLMDADLEDVEV